MVSSRLTPLPPHLTYPLAAIQIVISRDSEDLGDPNLLPQLVQVGTRCQGNFLLCRRWYTWLTLLSAFTEHQVNKLSDLADSCLHDTVASSVNTSHCDLRSSPGSSRSSPDRRSPSAIGRPVRGPIEDRQLEALAREFGVGSELVEALAHRLSAMC